MRRRGRRVSFFKKEEDSDPLSVVVNLFDVAMVFAVSLMVAMVMHMNMTEVFTDKDFTIVKNPGKDNMEIITKEGKQINRYTPSHDQSSGGKRGKKVGIAYELENGEIIYMKPAYLILTAIIAVICTSCSKESLMGKLHVRFDSEDNERLVTICAVENPSIVLMEKKVPKESDFELCIGNYVISIFNADILYSDVGVQIRPDKTTNVSYSAEGISSVSY